MDAKTREKIHDWAEQEDTELCMDYCLDGEKQIDETHIGDKRIRKIVSLFKGIRMMTKNPVSYALLSIENLKNTTSRIANNKDEQGKAIVKRKYAPSYKADCIKLLGRLYVFKSSNGETRGLEFADMNVKKAVKYVPPDSEKREAKQVITEEELQEMVDNCEGNLFDMAFLQLLYFSAGRFFEVMSLSVGDIEFNGLDVYVHIRSKEGNKQGERKINLQINGGLPNLVKWIAQHPMRTKKGLDPKAPLWISPNTRGILSDVAINKRIRRIVGRVNRKRTEQGLPLFNNPTNVHNFRHSMSTNLAVNYDYTTEQLRAYRGDSESSEMPAHYTHLCGNFEMMKGIVNRKKTDFPEKGITGDFTIQTLQRDMEKMQSAMKKQQAELKRYRLKEMDKELTKKIKAILLKQLKKKAEG